MVGILPTTNGGNMDIIAHITTTPITVNALQRATGLSQTALALALVSLGGKVTIQEGGIVLAPTPVKEKVPAGPRGPTAKVAPRLEACRSALLAAVAVGPVSALELLKAAGEAYVYTDILLVTKEELAKGTIIVSRKGRKATWTLPGAE
jgi:hypothetical protein